MFQNEDGGCVFHLLFIYFSCLYYLILKKNAIQSHATRTQHNIRQMTPNHEYARKCI